MGVQVAITHNFAFAGRLDATHILRVQSGTVKLADNFGLSEADFDHTQPKQPAKAAAKATGKAAPQPVKKGGAAAKKVGLHSFYVFLKFLWMALSVAPSARGMTEVVMHITVGQEGRAGARR